jgi:uncharacterized membrane protein
MRQTAEYFCAANALSMNNISPRRVELFSDGVISISITIMAFEMKTSGSRQLTEASQWPALMDTIPVALIYLLSFGLLGIAWVGHHEMFFKVKKVDTKLLWLNMLLLFWLTLVPLTTYMMGRYPGLSLPVAGYGFNMLMMTAAFILCRRHILEHHMLISRSPTENAIAYKMARNKHIRSHIGLSIYILSIYFAFVFIPLSYVCFVIPSILSLMPGTVKNTLFTWQLRLTLRKRHRHPRSGIDDKHIHA